ncbi:SDR family NAD(P)-dependent oxidoreductase [Nocardia sp. NPDC050793]|uniref:SDR family NAD(P)-dependent oxidoreductase n=1 Tax=Nocardia sp. NPDC050793 TaxID=3155159 RepID=UPI0034005509
MVDPGVVPIAIVGMGCRFPGGIASPQALWAFLLSAGSAVGSIPLERWDNSRFHDPEMARPGTMYMQHLAALDSIDLFDSSFFGIASAEADRMDPQQRLLLQASWEAFEDAGIAPDSLRGSQTGVFTGVSLTDYYEIQKRDPAAINSFTNAGGALSIAANRLSYFYDFHGPSLSLDTACSSSLMAVHLACESLRRGESSLAVAAGANIILRPESSIGFCQAGMISRQGLSRAFDTSADGFVRGEGIGVLVLQPLDHAVAQRRRIYAVLRASGTNQDGRTSNLHFPSVDAQKALLAEIYEHAGVEPADVSAIEAHGTGTLAGDRVECQALGEVLGMRRCAPLPIGSVKGNLGHTEAVSGLAGLMKAALSLHHRRLPAHQHFVRPHPDLTLEAWGLRVPQQTEPLPARTEPHVIGVNSFGFGGSNVHVIVEEAPPRSVRATEPGPLLLPLSAKTPAALQALAIGYHEMLATTDVSVHDVCFSAAVHRAHHRYRIGCVARDRTGLLEALRAVGTGDREFGRAPEQPLSLVMVFTGNGPQWWGMGRQLREFHPVFARTLQRCDELLSAMADWSLLDELAEPEETSRLRLRTDIGQCALFAVQAALFECYREWGIEPTTVVGHSAGEIAAFYAAGVYSLADAVSIAYHRSRLQETTNGSGATIAVGISDERARHDLEDAGLSARLAVAAINAPDAVTLAGEASVLDSFVDRYRTEGVFVRSLGLPYGFHSALMDPLREPLLLALAHLRPHPPRIRCVSTVLGRALMAGEGDAAYWWRNTRETVRFADAMRLIMAEGPAVFLEIGPHPALRSYLHSCDCRGDQVVLGSLRRDRPEHESLLASLADLYRLGIPVDWGSVQHGNFVSVPTYPWQLTRHWKTPRREQRWVDRVQVHPVLGARLPAACPMWEQSLDEPGLSYFADHRVGSATVVPGAALLEGVLALSREIHGDKPCTVTNLVFHQALVLDCSRVLQTRYSPEDGVVRFSSRPVTGETWVLHASARLDLGASTSCQAAPEQLRGQCSARVDCDAIYTRYAELGLAYGPAFVRLDHLSHGAGAAVGEVCADGLDIAGYLLHPALLDGAFQMILVGFLDGDPVAHLPACIESFRYYPPPDPVTRVCVGLRLSRIGIRGLTAELTLATPQGTILAEAEIHTNKVDLVGAGHASRWLDWMYTEEWVPAPIDESAPVPEIAALHDGLLRQRRRLADECSLERYYRTDLPLSERLALLFTLDALRKLGASGEVGAVWRPEQMTAELGILPRHRELVSVWCEYLHDAGYTDADGVVRQPLPADPTGALLAQALRDCPGSQTELLLIARCGEHLAGMLAGDIDPASLLFSGEHVRDLGDLYEAGVTERMSNRMAQTLLEQVLASLPEGHDLSVLELGAGTGGTSTYLLPLLTDRPVRYVFSDVSPLFLDRARSKYKDIATVEYRLCDLELPLTDQGYQPGEFDLIVAPHVLHATADLRSSLQRIRELLADRGVLCLLEPSQTMRWQMLLIFGTLKSYWARKDTDLRPRQPLLSADEWRDLLRSSGFATIVDLSGDELPEPPHTVMVAQHRSDNHKPRPTPPSALIVPDSTGLAERLHERLPDSQVQRGLDVLPTSAQHLICLCAYDDVTDGDSAAALLEAARRIHQRLVTLLQQPWKEPPRLTVVTAGAFHGPGDTRGTRLTHAMVAGLVRTAISECPELRPRIIDIGPPVDSASVPAYAEDDLRTLVATLVDDNADGELIVRDGHRYRNQVTKLHAIPQASTESALFGDTLHYELVAEQTGALDSLRLHARPDRSLRPDEVEIDVVAAGLNYHDLALLMGTLPEAESARGHMVLGVECAGRVRAVGSAVRRFRPGDEVLACGEVTCLASRVALCEDLVVPKPPTLSFEEAAGAGLSYLTGWYGLHQLARLEAGERILIHNASGGTGLAAVNLARWQGAEIFATAGTEDKRAYLRALGVRHVYDSRTLDFATAIRDETNGEGIDVVYSALGGDCARESLGLLRRFGRYIDLGKKDMLDNQSMPMASFRSAVSYHAVDIAKLTSFRPRVVRDLYTALMPLLAARELPALPIRLYELTQIGQAFRTMQRAGHIGKLVVSLRNPWSRVQLPPSTSMWSCHPGGTYLVAGGVRGFGLATARWLAERGAGHLVLCSRSGMPDADTVDILTEIRAMGAVVELHALDITERAQVDNLVHGLRAAGRNLRGVVHAAMVLDDTPLLAMDEQTWLRVLAPKMLGAWNLHQATQEYDLDLFLLYSSASALLGSAGQANYVAANTFLDALAAYRRARDLPATSVRWGAIAGSGHVARHPEMLRYLHGLGMGDTLPAQNWACLEHALQQDLPTLALLDMYWPTYASQLVSPAARARFARLSATGELPQVGWDSDEEYTDRPSTTFVSVLRGLCDIGVAEVHDDLTLTELGIDSLLATELSVQVKKQLGVDLPVMSLLNCETLADIRHLIER